MCKRLLRALALAGIIIAPVHAKEVHIAVVDIQALVRDSEYATQVSEVAQKQQRRVEQLMQKLNEQLEAERKRLMQASGDGSFGAMTDARIQNEFTASKRTLEAQLEKERVNASLEVEDASISCRNKIKALVAEYAAKHDLTAVLDPKSEGVLFADDNLDITEQVKQYISSQFKQEKRKSSLLASVTTDSKDAKNSTIIAAADTKVAEGTQNA